MIALCSKTYFVWGGKENKLSSKGLQQRRNKENLTKEKYLQCLFNKEVNGTIWDFEPLITRCKRINKRK